MEDQELRDRFDEWAQPLRATPAPAVAALRSRIRRRTARIAAATGSVLAVLGLVAGLLVAGGLARSGPNAPAPQTGQGGSARNPAPPGQPYVFVNSSGTFINYTSGPATPAELRNMATGKVVKVLKPVGQGASFTDAAAAPGDRLFVLAQQDNDSTVSFAELRISPAGKKVTLSPVMPHLTLPAGATAEGMTVNAPATRLSFFASNQLGVSGSLVVYNLQTGALIGRWPIRHDGFAISQFLGSGDELVVAASGLKDGQRVVDTGTAFRPGSSLLADSRPFRPRGIAGSFTQDGNVYMNSDDQVGSAVVLKEFSAASGKLLREIPIGSAAAANLNGEWLCGLLWASANGDDLLTQCGTRQLEVVNGRVSRVRLPWLLPKNDSFGTSTFAW